MTTKTLTLRALDIPSIHKFGIGFDSMFNDLMRLDNNHTQSTSNYPPYNIVQINEDEYMISIAVAGFGPDNLSVTKHRNMLVVEGTSLSGETDEVNYLHRGIGARNFKREFKLADYVDVVNTSLELGILNIYLKREVPEEQKPRVVAISYTK